MSLVYMSDKSGKQKGEAMFYPLSCCLGVGLLSFLRHICRHLGLNLDVILAKIISDSQINPRQKTLKNTERVFG